MKSDREVRLDVLEELRWIPGVDESRLYVEVSDGVVTLSGFAPDFGDRLYAETAARRVPGVRAVVNEIRIATDAGVRRADQAIAHQAIDAIRADLPEVADTVQVVVSDGHVTLEGTVPLQWQRDRLESVVRGISGVTVVSNLLVIKPRAVPMRTAATG